MRQSFKQQSIEARQLITFGIACEEAAAVDSGVTRLYAIGAAKQAAEERKAARGTVPTFPAFETADVTDPKRLHSAVRIGELAALPNVAVGKIPAPNLVLRSSLFAVIKKGNRKGVTRLLVASDGATDIKFTGHRLDQADLDVWLHCLWLSRDCLGTTVTVKVTEFLRGIGRSLGTRSYEWLRDSLARLAFAGVTIANSNSHECMVQDRMLEFYSNDTGEPNVSICVSAAWASLFGVDSWTALAITNRQRLVGKPLAQWLAGFYSTHSRPIPLKISKLQTLCGSESSPKEFRKSLAGALQSCVDAGALSGFKFMENGLLAVFR